MIRLLKGDDTGGTFGRAVQVTIKTPTGASLAGCYAEFIFDGLTKIIAAPLVPNEQREIFYSHNETERMALGTRNGTFRVIDSAGKIRTCDNTIPVLVTDRVKSVYLGTSAIEVEIGSAISCAWSDVTAKPAWVSPSNEGTANQVLTRTATGSQWTNPPATSIAWADVTGKPSTFPPSSHTHTVSQITDFASEYVSSFNVWDSDLATLFANTNRPSLIVCCSRGYNDSFMFWTESGFVAIKNGEVSGMQSTSAELSGISSRTMWCRITKFTDPYGDMYIVEPLAKWWR